jgi:hypothetical protein
MQMTTELDPCANGRSYPVYITHTKPAEIAPLSQPKADGSAIAIHWLSAGQVFDM